MVHAGKESCDEEIWLRKEKLLRKRVVAVGTVTRVVLYCLAAHPVNLPLANGMKYCQISISILVVHYTSILVLFTAVNFAQVKKRAERHVKSSRSVRSKRATETKAAGVQRQMKMGGFSKMVERI